MTWRDALWAVSIDFVNAAPGLIASHNSGERLPSSDAAGLGAAPRFELDESAFMDAIELIPLFLQKSDSELRELVRNGR